MHLFEDVAAISSINHAEVHKVEEEEVVLNSSED